MIARATERNRRHVDAGRAVFLAPDALDSTVAHLTSILAANAFDVVGVVTGAPASRPMATVLASRGWA